MIEFRDERELTRLNILWTWLRLNTVGHSPSTIVDYHRELQTMSRCRCRKFLSSIVETLQRCVVMATVAVDRDLISMVKAFDVALPHHPHLSLMAEASRSRVDQLF